MKKHILASRLKKITSRECGLVNLTLILKKAQKEKKKGVKFIDCALGEPSFVLPKTVKRVGQEAIENDENSYVQPFFGLFSLRKSLSLAFKREGIEVLPDQIIVTAGTGVAIDLLFRAIINPGEEVIIFDPFYPPFVIHTLAYGGRVVFVDTYKTSFIPDPVLIEKKIAKKTKAIVINSPNNPTGTVYPLKLLKAIVKIARKFNLMVISDEVYADFVYEGKFTSLIKLCPERAIILRSFSKKYGMMGYKVGYMTGPKDLIEKIKLIMEPMHTGPRVSEMMAAKIIKYPLSKRIFNRLKKRRNFLYENLKNYYPNLIKPRGTLYFYIQAPHKDALRFSLKLLKRGVLVSPAFSRKNSHFRVSFAGLEEKGLKKFVTILQEVSLGNK